MRTSRQPRTRQDGLSGAPRHQRLQMVRPRDRLLSDLKHLVGGPAAAPSRSMLIVTAPPGGRVWSCSQHVGGGWGNVR